MHVSRRRRNDPNFRMRVLAVCLGNNWTFEAPLAAAGFRADLRAVYQYYCRNLPRPDEPAAIRAVARLQSLTGNSATAIQFWEILKKACPG